MACTFFKRTNIQQDNIVTIDLQILPDCGKDKHIATKATKTLRALDKITIEKVSKKKLQNLSGNMKEGK